MGKRSRAKDILAWTIIYGGTSAVLQLIKTGGMATGILSESSARALTGWALTQGREVKRQAWEKYQRTGNIWTMFSNDG